MDDDQQPNTPEQTSSEVLPPKPSPKKLKMRKILLVLLGLGLVGAIGYGGYSYGTKKNDNNSTTSTTAQSDANGNSRGSGQKADAATSSFHTVEYGSLEGKQERLVKLAFPNSYQSIAYMNDEDTFRSVFGDDEGSSTYDGGHWEIGNPENGRGFRWGYVGIMGIAPDWKTRNGYASYGGFNTDTYASDPSNATINGYKFYSAKDKKASLKKLINDTSACAKNPTQGFTISNMLDVCYKPVLIKQSYASYSPRVELNGYGVINDVPFVLFGTVEIRGGLDDYSDADLDKAGNEFKAGKIPAQTQKNIDAFIEAFKNSSIKTD